MQDKGEVCHCFITYLSQSCTSVIYLTWCNTLISASLRHCDGMLVISVTVLAGITYWIIALIGALLLTNSELEVIEGVFVDVVQFPPDLKGKLCQSDNVLVFCLTLG